MDEVVLQASGLHTDPNPHGTAPAGGMLDAKNIVIRRPHLVEPRPGFSSVTPLTGTNHIRTLIPFDGTLFAHELDSTNKIRRLSDNTAITQLAAPPDATKDASYRYAVLADRLHLTGYQKTQRYRPEDDDFANASVPKGTSGLAALNSTDTPAWLADDDAVAYRILFYDIHPTTGQKFFGAPSSRIYIHNSAGAARSITLTIPLFNQQTGPECGDLTDPHIQVYRSRAVTTDGVEPDDDMMLVADVEITSSDIAAGSWTYTDVIDEENLGARIYTASDQEGIAGANDPLPMAHDVAEFREHLFLANTEGPPRIQLELKITKDEDGEAGVGSEDFAGDTTVASDTITNVDSAVVDRLRIGMYVSDHADGPANAGTTIPAGSQITAFPSSTSVKLSNAALVTDTSVALTAYDHITINGTAFFATSGANDVANRLWQCSATLGARLSIQNLVHVHNMATVGEEGITAYDLGHFVIRGAQAPQGSTSTAPRSIQEQFSSGSLGGRIGSRSGIDSPFDLVGIPATAMEQILEAADLPPINPGAILLEDWSFDGFTVTASSGQFWSPELDSTTALNATQDVRPNRLHWSKPNQPHTSPITFYADVGDMNKRIVRIIPTRDALFIFKEDGCWRLTGDGVTSWRIDPFDPTLKLIHPNSIVTIDDTIVGWFSRGICTVTDAGQEVISGPIDSDIGALQSALSVYPDNARGLFAIAYESEGEYWLGVPSAAGVEVSTKIYVFNFKTGTWTYQDVAKSSGVVNPADDKLYFGGASFALVKERKGETVENADQSYSVTVSDVSGGTTITISGGSGWTPAIGDMVLQSSVRYLVTDFASATVFTVHTSGLTAAAATAYVGFESTVKFIAKSAQDPFSMKHWVDNRWTFHSLINTYTFTLKYDSTTKATQGTNSPTVTLATTDVAESRRYFVPRNHARCSLLFPQFVCRQAGAHWILAGTALGFRPMSNRLEAR